MGWTMGFQLMCFPNSQIEINIRFFVLLFKEMQHNSLKSKKKSMKIKEKFQIFDINLRLYILHNIQWFKHEPTSGHWFLVGRFYRVRTMIVTLKIVPKKLGSMVFQWHGHYVCQCLLSKQMQELEELTELNIKTIFGFTRYIVYIVYRRGQKKLPWPRINFKFDFRLIDTRQGIFTGL